MSQTAENPTPSSAPTPTPATPRRSGSEQSAGRRTRVIVRKVGPWSVLKFSLLFYLCVMLIVYFALMIIYWLLSAVGAIDSAGRLLGYVFATGSAGDTQAVEIKFGSVFGWLLLIGLGNVGIWSLVNVFVAFLYNLISDVVGGIEVTLAQKR